jgi:hypothetical protein
VHSTCSRFLQCPNALLWPAAAELLLLLLLLLLPTEH